jgi:hypothetical protein
MTGKAMRQDEPSQFDQWMQSYDRYMMEEEDELGVYMRQGPVRRENLNPILWWKEHQEEYPRLSKFALDILAIPAMSVDPERTISVTKLTNKLAKAQLKPRDNRGNTVPTELARPSSDHCGRGRQLWWGPDGLGWRGGVRVPIASSWPQVSAFNSSISIQFKLSKFTDHFISSNQVTPPNLTYLN